MDQRSSQRARFYQGKARTAKFLMSSSNIQVILAKLRLCVPQSSQAQNLLSNKDDDMSCLVSSKRKINKVYMWENHRWIKSFMVMCLLGKIKHGVRFDTAFIKNVRSFAFTTKFFTLAMGLAHCWSCCNTTAINLR